TSLKIPISSFYQSERPLNNRVWGGTLYYKCDGWALLRFKKPLNQYLVHANLLYVDVRRSHVSCSPTAKFPHALCSSAPFPPFAITAD
ncbi:MAG: hypothetical protein PHY41_02865, partial [Candidatus Cloacimonetes bacterium]|nr:hypothetical protein [Candidatus Cloacimonadota bacterium]